MNRKQCSIVLIMFGMILVSANAFSADPDMLLTLSIEPANPIVGEPVTARAELVNQSTAAFSVYDMSRRSQTLAVFVQSEKSDEFRRIYMPYNATITFPPQKNVFPGEVLVSEELLLFDFKANNLVFPDAGTYTVRAVYYGLSAEYQNTWMTQIDVLISSAPVWEAAGSLLFSQKDTVDLIYDYSESTTTIQNLKNFLTSNPSSLFAPYSAYYAGQALAQKGRASPEVLNESVDYITQADVPGFRFRAKALVSRGQWQWELGRSTAAFSSLDQVITDFPGTKEAEEALYYKTFYETQTPLPLYQEKISVEGADRVDIETLIHNYINAFQTMNLNGCLDRLTNDFVYNSAIDKTGMAAVLQTDFSSIAALSGAFSMDRDIQSVDQIGDKIEAVIEITPVLDGVPMDDPARVKLKVVKPAAQWLISKWERM